jgi:hypothetical protein
MESGDAKKLKQLVERRPLKKLLVSAGLRAAAGYVIQQYAISDRHACGLMERARSMHRYRSGRPVKRRRPAGALEGVSIGSLSKLPVNARGESAASSGSRRVPILVRSWAFQRHIEREIGTSHSELV